MQKSSPEPYYGAILPVVLFVVFLVLKLTGVISWSWWWVTSPLLITAAPVAVLAVISFCVYLFAGRKR